MDSILEEILDDFICSDCFNNHETCSCDH
ncbi:hypothetical protein KLEB273_gp251 [Bacillus phage vB_BauM_KLEB27-3]|nr:hypothetical protein KLEB273_gp251 [Bacillus phage vB_BauM_KLEB27-3]